MKIEVDRSALLDLLEISRVAIQEIPEHLGDHLDLTDGALEEIHTNALAQLKKAYSCPKEEKS